jgi:hypothetical protein
VEGEWDNPTVSYREKDMGTHTIVIKTVTYVVPKRQSIVAPALIPIWSYGYTPVKKEKEEESTDDEEDSSSEDEETVEGSQPLESSSSLKE